MNTYIKKIVTITAFLGYINTYADAATVQELLAKQEDIITLLQEYWVDEKGNMRVGNKDATSQFSFNKSLIDRMTDAQLKAAMNTALSRFTSAQQAAFKDTVTPFLNELKANKEQVAKQAATVKVKMDEMAKALAQALGKTPQDIMRLAEQNLKTLIINNIEDRTKRLNALDQLTTFAQLRKDFATEATAATTTAGSKRPSVSDTDTDTKLSSATTSAKQKIAQGIANTNFRISSMAGFIGESIKYSYCRDRHFDILPDSEGVQFISEAR